MMQGITFGFINGIIDMLALLTGLWATKVSKVGIIGAMIALIISNPLNDSYALYISEESTDSEKAKAKAKSALISQIATHAVFLLIVIFSPNITTALIISFILSTITIIGFNQYNNINIFNTRNTLIVITLLVFVTYVADNAVFKYFKR
jgi:hypothetical protein